MINSKTKGAHEQKIEKRITLNLLVRRTWSNLTDSFYLNHVVASSTFFAISSTTSTYTGSTVSCISSQAVPTTPGMNWTVFFFISITHHCVTSIYTYIYMSRRWKIESINKTLQNSMINQKTKGLMSKRLRIKLNLLVRRAWSNLTELFTSTILQHLQHIFYNWPFVDLVFF